MRTRIALVGAIAILGVSRPAAAQLKPTSPVFVVDLSGAKPESTVVSVRTFNEALAGVLPIPPSIEPLEARAGAATPLERVADACRTPPAGSFVEAIDIDAAERRRTLIGSLQKCVGCLKAHQELRYMTDRGDEVLLIVLFRSSQPDEIIPTFVETPRASELVATAKAMLGLIRTTEKESLPVDCRAFPYTLLYRRSTFKVSVSYPSTAETAAAAASASTPVAAPPSTTPPAEPSPTTPESRLLSGAKPPAAASSPQTAAASAATVSEVTTPVATLGPPERWIFSADFSIPVTSIRLNGQPEAEAERVKNKDFSIALNFAFRDLLVDRRSALQKRSILKDLILKIQVSPSRTPWEAWAVGLGLRGEHFSSLLWNFDVVHPYFTFGMQKDETDTRRWRGVFGLGFDPRSLKR